MYTITGSTQTKVRHSEGKTNGMCGGYSLVEVTMAMGVMAFCLVAMVGMIPVGLMQERRSVDQLTASQVLAAVGSDFQNGGNGVGETLQYRIPMGAGSDGSFYVSRSLEYTDTEIDAAHQVWYRINGDPGSSGELRMHLSISRARPGQMEQFAQGQIIAEGIVQQRLN